MSDLNGSLQNEKPVEDDSSLSSNTQVEDKGVSLYPEQSEEKVVGMRNV